jgi:hypothetical protein
MLKNIVGLKKNKIIDLGCGTYCLEQELYNAYKTRAIFTKDDLKI